MIPADHMPQGATVTWFEIDEHNHGSLATYPSQEVYESYKAQLDSWRKDISTEVEAEMTMETMGPIKVDVRQGFAASSYRVDAEAQ